MKTQSSGQWLDCYPDAPDVDHRLELDAERAVKKAESSLVDLSQHADPESRYAASELDEASAFAREAIDELQTYSKDLKIRLQDAGDLNELLAEQLSDVLAFVGAIYLSFSNTEEETEFTNWCRLFLKGDWEYHDIPPSKYRDRRLPPEPIRGFLIMNDESDRILYKMRWC